jgi:hypothetical protein
MAEERRIAAPGFCEPSKDATFKDCYDRVLERRQAPYLGFGRREMEVMWSKIFGLSAGLALGAAMLAAPAAASTLIIEPGETDAGADVGSIDTFLGGCDIDPGTGDLAHEIACINEWQSDHVFVVDDALKMEDLTLLFQAVDDTDTGGINENIWAVELDKQGGWFSIKTGNITCDTEVTSSTGAECAEGQNFLVFENLDLLLYAVFDLDGLAADHGYVLTDIYKISHITIVPLPATALLFGSALLGGGLMRRRKMIKEFGLPS